MSVPIDLFGDSRIINIFQKINRFQGKTALESGSLEGAHTSLMIQLGANEYRDIFNAMKMRFILYVLSIFFLGLGILSCVVSLLLWAVLPILNPQNYWLMIVLPISLLAASPLLLVLANRLKIQLNFIEIRKKIKLNTRRICQTIV